MKNVKKKNPLVKRIPRELLGDWRKYLVVSLFLILTIGFVSGMYVANGSMMKSAEEGITRYKLEDGHFELKHEASEELLLAIESGKKADIKQYYLDAARKELDDKFEDEFKKTFSEKFDSEFSQAEQPGVYQTAFDTAYDEAYQKAREKAYQEAYDEAYQEAYNEAWMDIQEEVEEEYADAEEKYELDAPDFKAVPVELYENFYKNADEDNDNDGESDGTIRVYTKTEEINLSCLMKGCFPETEDEIAIDRMHADNAGIEVGDHITVTGQSYKVVGLIACVNYSTLHEKSSDFMFDAIKFDVAMVTKGGFERISKPVHYTYAWKYTKEPADEKEEKSFSDDFLKALLTQTVTGENEIEDYIPGYADPAVHFAPDDMGSDEAMGGVLLDILIVIIAFIFAITISNTITKEASAIGTLRALGYRQGELIRHYLAMPVIVTLIAAGVGNILGYTVFKSIVVSMYYNSYSLPAYETIWNPEAFIKTTLIPVILMLIVNLAVIMKMMRHTPLQFLRHDLKKSKRKKAVRLPGWNFLGRFRMRIIFQNIPNYVILFAGIFFVMVMLAMAVGMPYTLKYYKENAEDMMFARYQYVLKSYEDEEGKVIDTKNKDAEKFSMHTLKFSMQTLKKKGGSLDEEISVYGIADASRYVKISDLQSLKENEIYISTSFGDKYGLKTGDMVVLDEKYENMQYPFRIAGMYDRCLNLSVFMPMENFRSVFKQDEDEFGGYMSDSEITDIEDDNIAAIVTKQDITKMCDQLDHSMGDYMQYFQILCILLSAVMIYLLTKIIIEKNETSISMTKILGYENREIASLYLLSTTIILLIADGVSVIWGTGVMTQAWKMIMLDYSGWFTFRIEPAGYVKMFAFVLIGYLLVMTFDFRRIKKIPMDAALKNIE